MKYLRAYFITFGTKTDTFWRMFCPGNILGMKNMNNTFQTFIEFFLKKQLHFILNEAQSKNSIFDIWQYFGANIHME